MTEIEPTILVPKQALIELLDRVDSINEDDGECFMCDQSGYDEESEEWGDIPHLDTCPLVKLAERIVR